MRIISITMKTSSLSDIYINPISRILFIIPYIIYKCISNKYSWKINLKFTIKDWIIFILILIILYLHKLFGDYVLSEMYYFKASYYTVRYFEFLLIFIFLSLLMKFVFNFYFYAHHIISIIMIPIIIIILTIISIFNVNYNYFSNRHFISLVLFIFLIVF